MEFYTWDEMEKEVLSDTIARKIISGDKAMVAQVFLAKGAIVPEHHHESEQITYILEGALKFEIGGREIVVGKGQVLRIPSNVPHRAVALEDTLDLDIFSPIRQDWLKKDDAYLRGCARAGPVPPCARLKLICPRLRHHRRPPAPPAFSPAFSGTGLAWRSTLPSGC